MDKIIKGVKLQNFKRFPNLSLDFDETLNLFIGDNESGKSTIVSAIDLVLSGSRSKVERYGLRSLFNKNTINEFLESEKKYADLPILFAELYLNDQNNKDLEGKYNSSDLNTHGLQLLCEPRDDLSSEISDILDQQADNFPFEYYSITFKTFAGKSYSGYRKYMQHLLIDNSLISSDYAKRQYVKTIYSTNTEDAEKNKYENEYRNYKDKFRREELSELNTRIEGDYTFAVDSGPKSNLENDLIIREGDISLDDKGKGKQCFIKTDFALQKKEADLDTILLEEPENHLSHTNMKRLVQKIHDSETKQLFITTHSSLISSRLDLRRAILLNSLSTDYVHLDDLNPDTARFFMKAPNNNLLEFILSRKVLLVEGDAEFILLKAFFEEVASTDIEDTDVHIISVGGTSFKRYLEIANLLGIKTAVITDNDGNYQVNCQDRYDDYLSEDTKVFADEDNSVSTFEKAVYKENKSICDELFAEGRRTLSVQEYMLSNKTEAAFEILDNKRDELSTPQYIEEAIEWINQ